MLYVDMRFDTLDSDSDTELDDGLPPDALRPLVTEVMDPAITFLDDYMSQPCLNGQASFWCS